MVWANSKGILPAGLRDGNLGAAATEEPAAVLVVLVPNTDAVAAVRRAVSADRIVAASPEAIALREGRIVAASRDAASELIGRVGWVDARIEILTPGPRDAARPKAGAVSARDGEVSARDNELNELAKKPTLSQVEAMRALELLY